MISTYFVYEEQKLLEIALAAVVVVITTGGGGVLCWWQYKHSAPIDELSIIFM